MYKVKLSLMVGGNFFVSIKIETVELGEYIKKGKKHNVIFFFLFRFLVAWSVSVFKGNISTTSRSFAILFRVIEMHQQMPLPRLKCISLSMLKKQLSGNRKNKIRS